MSDKPLMRDPIVPWEPINQEKPDPNKKYDAETPVSVWIIAGISILGLLTLRMCENQSMPAKLDAGSDVVVDTQK